MLEYKKGRKPTLKGHQRSYASFKEIRKVMSKSLGELMIGCELNPAGVLAADTIDQKLAKMINQIDKMPGDKLQIANAQVALQQAAELIRKINV